MADIKKKSFLRSGEPSLVNYDWVDVADGTGVIAFFTAVNQTSAAKDHILTTNQVYSEDIEVGEGSVDYDLTAFNSPRTVRGTAYFSVGISSSSAGAGYITAQLKKYDGSSETNISSAIQSISLTSGAVKMLLVPLPLTSTSFKIGDLLRLTVVLTGVAPSVATMGCDPKGRAGGTLGGSAATTTTSIIYVPFKLNL